jgi:uncharacterized SAM-binding protein YcdF (DUF218 family)
MFWLKKFVAFWLMPVPFSLTVLTVGWCLLWSRQRRALGRWLIGAGIALLLLFSNKAFSVWLIRPLEMIYPAVPEFTEQSPVPPELAACRYVVVLGGGHADTAQFSAVNKLSTSAQGRLLEGIRILRALPDAKLVVSGYGDPGRPTHAAVLAQAAISVGVPPARIVRLDSPRDTEDESGEIRRLVGDGPYALVTSAWHLRRATALMRAAGTHPVPCPADFRARPNPEMKLSDYGWDVDSLSRSTWAVYERIGYLWLKLRGRV